LSVHTYQKKIALSSGGTANLTLFPKGTTLYPEGDTSLLSPDLIPEFCPLHVPFKRSGQSVRHGGSGSSFRRLSVGSIAHLRALPGEKRANGKTVERWGLYVRGIELANC
jgi:hypothetical protein